jgi:myo-inositol-1(or 4)-monophosphatase
MIDFDRFHHIVGEAGRLALASWPGHGHALDVWDKNPGNPVSAADIAVDTYLKRELGALLPAAGWLSEETADDSARLGKSLCWLVDPIDGTRDFVRGRPGWAVSVALISEGRPLIAALDAPARGELWFATAGRHTGGRARPCRCVAPGRSRSRAGRQTQFHRAAHCHGRGGRSRSPCHAALGL